jgi:hypothetical protein
MDHVKHLLDSCRSFGSARYIEGSFNRNSVSYPALEITTDEGIVTPLYEECNKSFNSQAGYKARIEFIGMPCNVSGKCKYNIEIIPQNNLSLVEQEKAAQEVLLHLPHVFRNLRVKHKR